MSVINSKAVSTFRGRILNCLPSSEQSLDWQLESAKNAGLLTAEPLPSSVDLRAGWWTIGDQGSTGSCVGWAAADSVIRLHMVEAGKLRQDEPLSVRQVWMASKESDEWASPPTTYIEAAGTSLKTALDVARNFGIVPSNKLPFEGPHFFQGKQDDFYAIAAQRKISSYFNLGTKPSHWRRWLANNGPILTRLDCDTAWFDASAANPVLDNYRLPDDPGGHAVAMVGYTEDHFIIRNSWGTGWGENGFAYATEAYAAAAFTEAYGISL